MYLSSFAGEVPDANYILVDDVVETGRTVRDLTRYLHTASPKSRVLGCVVEKSYSEESLVANLHKVGFLDHTTHLVFGAVQGIDDAKTAALAYGENERGPDFRYRLKQSRAGLREAGVAVLVEDKERLAFFAQMEQEANAVLRQVGLSIAQLTEQEYSVLVQNGCMDREGNIITGSITELFERAVANTKIIRYTPADVEKRDLKECDALLDHLNASRTNPRSLIMPAASRGMGAARG